MDLFLVCDDGSTCGREKKWFPPEELEDEDPYSRPSVLRRKMEMMELPEVIEVRFVVGGLCVLQ